jgi:NAD(P)H-dependent FMN reductase
MMTIIGVSGSLRKQSFNTALLRTAATLMPAGSTLDVRTLHGIPLYDGDEEAEHGIPPAVATLKEAIVGASGVILSTPEYNTSIPGVFKNAVDWLSRPPADIKRVFAGRPVALMGATPGLLGTVLSQTAWLPVLRTLGMDLWMAGRLRVPGAGKVFSADGTIVDEAVRQQLHEFLAGFVAFVSRR